MADPGGPGPPLFLDQNEGRRAEKNSFGGRAHPYLWVWMTAPPPLSEGLDPPLGLFVEHYLLKLLRNYSLIKPRVKKIIKRTL